ncbi:hypothetical protein [Methanobrevibacter sp.]|uniref:hypothetical protein n=1 Tax=Methanobrevibacter sp. TaxID=66852 RepID=UPI00388DB55A
MFKKALLISTIALIMIGAVSAVDLEGFTAPENFKDLGDGVYVLYDSLGNADEILSVVEHNEHDWQDYITNDTNNSYTVFKGENNTYNYTDGSQDESGSFELIEVNGHKYIIDFTKVGIDKKNNFTATFENLSIFNKLNNVTPLIEE